jgi:hypothetical protein
MPTVPSPNIRFSPAEPSQAARLAVLIYESSQLTVDEAHREVEDLLAQFPVIYPTESTLRTALRGAALYKFSWFEGQWRAGLPVPSIGPDTTPPSSTTSTATICLMRKQL